MFWKILKIEATTDKKAIKAAYRQLLAKTNPEDHPEEFKQLREAYEQAMAYADALMHVKTPVERWADQLNELYDDYPRRLEVDNWKHLLNEKIALGIDTRMECEDVLLHFLMEDYLLPHEVWVYLDSQFNWLQRTQELYGSYPKDFIDYVVINGIRYEDTLPMKMFEPGLDGQAVKEYLAAYYDAGGQDEQKVDEAIRKMEESAESHPYGKARICSIRIDKGDLDALEELSLLQEKHPSDMHIGLLLVRHLIDLKDHERCFKVINELKKIAEDDIYLRFEEANCLALSGDLHQAVKNINGLLNDTAGNVQMQYELDNRRREWNEQIIAELEPKVASDPNDVDSLVELAWSYLENDYLAKADELSVRIPEDLEDRFNYYNLKASIALSLEHFAQAADYLKQLCTVIEGLPEDTKENRARKKRHGETLLKLGFCYEQLKEDEKAKEVYEQALNVCTNKAEVLTHLCQSAYMAKDYRRCIELAGQLIEVFPEGYHGYLLLGLSSFALYDDRTAFEAVERALELCNNDVAVYVLKARILLRNGAADGARDIVQMLSDGGVGEDPAVLFLKGVLAEGDHDDAAAISNYERSLEACKGKENETAYGGELYYRLLSLKGENLNAAKEEDRKLMMDLAERGLKCEPNHYGLLDYKGWLLIRGKEYEQAMAIYRKLEAYPNHSPAVEEQIGYIYYRDLSHDADKALEYYEKSLAAGGDVSGHFYAGMCNMYMMRLDEAERHFLILEKEDGTVDGPLRLSYVYAMENKLDQAIGKMDQVLKMTEGNEGDLSRYYVRKAMLLRRMKRYDEAIATIEESMKRYGHPYGDRIIFQIYCQAGRFDEARKHLQDWGKKKTCISDYNDCLVLLEMYCNDFASARMTYEKVKDKIDGDRALEIGQLLDEHDGRHADQLEVLLAWLDHRQKNGAFDLSRIKGALATCHFRLHDLPKAEQYAKEALDEIDEKLAGFETDRMIFLARKIKLLALLGRKEEMLEVMKECETAPFCQSCPEHHCKDVDIFKMEAAEVLGERKKAYELARLGAQLYPDEEDFLIGLSLLEKEGKC